MDVLAKLPKDFNDAVLTLPKWTEKKEVATSHSSYLLYCYSSTNTDGDVVCSRCLCTSFTGTKVQILTPEDLRARC